MKKDGPCSSEKHNQWHLQPLLAVLRASTCLVKISADLPRLQGPFKIQGKELLTYDAPVNSSSSCSVLSMNTQTGHGSQGVPMSSVYLVHMPLVFPKLKIPVVIYL